MRSTHPLFALLLAGAAEAHAGERLEALLRDGLAALPAAGHAVYPLRAAPVHGGARPHQGGFPVHAFQFRGLVENVHASLANAGGGSRAAP